MVVDKVYAQMRVVAESLVAGGMTGIDWIMIDVHEQNRVVAESV